MHRTNTKKSLKPWLFTDCLFPHSVREKEENMKTVESLLEKGLIEVANKEEELKVCVFFFSFTLFRKGWTQVSEPQETSENLMCHTHTWLTSADVFLFAL